MIQKVQKLLEDKARNAYSFELTRDDFAGPLFLRDRSTA